VSTLGRTIPMSVLCLALGCGRVHYGLLEDGGGRSGIDAARPGGPRCDWAGTPSFDTPIRIERGPGGDTLTGPSLSPDGLVLTYMDDGTALTMRRASLTAAFAPAGPDADLAEFAPRLSGAFTRRDGREQFLAFAGPSGFSDLFVRTREMAGPWSAPVALAVSTDADHEWDGFLEADGRTLWFQRQTAVGADLFRARRASESGPFGPEEPIPGLAATPEAEGSPTLPDDGSVVVFASSGAIWFARLTGGAAGTPERDRRARLARRYRLRACGAWGRLRGRLGAPDRGDPAALPRQPSVSSRKRRSR